MTRWPSIRVRRWQEKDKPRLLLQETAPGCWHLWLGPVLIELVPHNMRRLMNSYKAASLR